ncbi:MAG: hypothetical protein NTW21_35105, partial [Verrucomicrobia bacterium]|nr:hypothetical protein [Verrucomicrobiota bacterium]
MGRRYATAISTVPDGATGTAIGTGYANSVAIANQTGNVAATCAAVAAREYTGGGLTDWFLPSKDEILQLYAQRAIAGFPAGQVYWSSTEIDNDDAWTLWDSGNAFARPKTHGFRTRPIRMGTIGGTPTITTAGTLVAVDTTYGSPSPSPTQFMVSGTDLIAGITVTPPTGYEVSESESSGYAGSGTAITVGSAPTVNTTTIYVRLAATADVAGSPYSGDIVCSSPSADSKNVATVASTVTPTGGTPTITTAGTLVAVDTTYGSPSPSPTQFMVSGTDLTAGITVTPPTGYEVSVSESSGYAGSGTAITVGSPPTVNTTTIYVRLAATAGVAGSPYSGDIVCSSSLADSQNVATVASTVSKAEQAAITFAPASPQIYNTVQGLSASGGSGTGAFSYAVQSGPGTISDGTNLTATADTGTIVVRATKAADDNYNEATQDANVVAASATGVTYAVGDTGPGGGKVFYVDANIYLEAAPSNWGGETMGRMGRRYATAISTVPDGATGTAIGTGYANSVAIANQTGNVAATCAAVAAREYTGGGLTDWFLPSIDELLQLYAQRAIANFPTGQPYWSSTEKDNDEAWTLWDNGAKFPRPKDHGFRTRPIRMGTTGTGGTTYADWATANGVIGDPNGDSNNDGVQNGIAYFMDDTGRITNPSLNAGNTVTWTNGGKIPSSAYGTQFVVQTSTCELDACCRWRSQHQHRWPRWISHLHPAIRRRGR